jgi:murein DD-endopeptidase MepM/ murein hydrolase activator NlpD
MPLDFKTVANACIRRPFSAMFWLQLSACAIVGWTLLHGAVSLAPPGQAATPRPTGSPLAGAPQAAPASGAASEQAGASGAALSSGRDTASGQPPAEGASPGLSTTDVTVTRNDTLDRIFRRLKLNLADLASLRNLPGIRHALDSLRPGEALHFTHHDGALFGLERRLNETQTLKVSRHGDALEANVLQNPVETRIRTIHGVIDSSLFEAVAAAGAHDQTAVALADIFGWDIDFVLDVRSGDTFVVTYEQIWRDGTYLHDGEIEAAEFVNQGRAFRAVRYTDPDGHAHYYTPEGRSLHKAFLRAPVEFTRVSSRFNSARHHPILNLIRAHKGVDYAAPIGTPVHAAGDGSIRVAGSLGGYGNCVEIEHTRSIVTVYGHLSRFARGIHVGTHVAQGTVIGYVGMTGLATGPHLHYEYRVNGVFKNPQTVSLPAAAPIDARWHEDFDARSAPLLATLEPVAGPMLVSR